MDDLSKMPTAGNTRLVFIKTSVRVLKVVMVAISGRICLLIAYIGRKVICLVLNIAIPIPNAKAVCILRPD